MPAQFFKRNKYNAAKTVYNGVKYDSKFEAAVAARLDHDVQAGVILAYDRQVPVKITAFDAHGKEHLLCTHRVDFRMHNADGSFTLLEAKGFQTAEWKRKYKWLKLFWLPNHADHDYQLITEETFYSLNRS